MSRPEAAALLSLAESIADGAPIDWDAASADASERDRVLIRQLRVLSDLAGLHRSLPAAIGERRDAVAERHALAAPAIGNWAHLGLIERLGGGTSGDVYRAWDRHLERDVALKLLRADESTDDLHASQIAREGRLLARVRHANVITVHGVDAHDGRVGLWMELVRGVTLEQQIAARGPLSAREAAAVGIDLCRALAAIHAAGLIHRDVKAQNVMREDGGRIVLMDLGTGREMNAAADGLSSDLAGTPLYQAPEIFAGTAASERTDLYSLGVLLYRLVTGSFPVRATTIDELHAAHKHGRRVRLRDARADLPTGFVRVIDRAIAADPQQRYASAGAFEADLVHALGDAPSIAFSRERQERTRHMTRPRVAALIAALASVIAIAAIGWPRWRTPPGAAIVAGTIRSIAVLPLANLSGDPAQDYFADGMTDELIGRIGELGNIQVTSRTSALRFKGATTPLPQIARALHVDAVLEGSVTVLPASRPGDPADTRRVRINARLIYAGSDTQLWDRTFEAVLADALTLQSEVAKAVADGIRLRLTTAQQGTLARANRQNVDAQEAYLQGRYQLNNLSRDSLAAARQYLERAVQLDPTYARALASLSRCYRFMDLYGLMPRAEAATRAREAANLAVRLDPSDPEAQNVLAGAAFQYQWDWATAERSYRLAIELNPSYGFARSEYARFLMADDRLAEAMEQARIAEEEDPLSAEATGVVALALYYQRRYDEAIAARRRALQRDPKSAQQYLGLGRAYAGKGAFAEAIASLEEAVTLSSGAPFIIAELARTYAAAGRRDEALARLATMTSAPVPGATPPLPGQYYSYVYIELGDVGRALTWLQRGLDERDWNLLWARVDPRFDRVRGDPRFAAVLKQVSRRS